MKLAIIGCGAIVESFYLPAINELKEDISECILIDRNISQANRIKSSLMINSSVSDNYQKIISNVDGAIVATPPASHFQIAKDFLMSGVPVLVEKPLVETKSEINELVEILGNSNGKLMINNTRRYFPANQAIKKTISEGMIGELQKVVYHEGGEYNWPTVSGFYFNKESNAKGVLIDRGAHVIDLVVWWVEDEIEVVKYEDDSLGGPEAFCHAQLKSKKCEIDVKLSWLHKLSNEYKIVGTKGKISGSIYNWKSYSIHKNGKIKTVKVKHKEKLFNNFGGTVFNNFIKYVNGDSDAFTVSVHDVLPSITLIESMYKNRKRIKAPWQDRWVNYAK